MLDFVPNHTALDHPWVEDHPEYYVAGTELDLARAPQNYTRVNRAAGDRAARLRPRSVLPRLARHAAARLRQPGAAGGDGRRAAERSPSNATASAATWRCWSCPRSSSGPGAAERRPFWPDATARVRERAPGFCFMAEVYWDLEWTLQQQGFDYAYDKRLYDRLRDGTPGRCASTCCAGLDYQDRLARFLENHDEPRAAATFPRGMHQAAAIVTFLSPGLRFFHQGQFEGRRTASRRTSCARRTNRPMPCCTASTIGCSPPCAIRRSERPVAPPRMRGRHGTAIGRRTASLCRCGPAEKVMPACGDRELQRAPEPMLRSNIVRRSWRPARAAPGSDESGDLRARHNRSGRHAVCTSICRPGVFTCSRSPWSEVRWRILTEWPHCDRDAGEEARLAPRRARYVTAAQSRRRDARRCR